ncbi:MAG: UPF0175 family protein [Armatimonadetes bacterium]|nr:UPF0175 family protein [Armatimonadota bacterium]
MATITLDIPDTLTPEEARLEFAIALYAQEKVTFAQARDLAAHTTWSFRQELGKRRIPAHYDVEDLMADLAAMERQGM